MSIPFSMPPFFILPLTSSFSPHLHHFNKNDELKPELSLFLAVFPLQCIHDTDRSMSARNGKDFSLPFLVYSGFSAVSMHRCLIPFRTTLPIASIHFSTASTLNFISIQCSINLSL